MEISELRNIFKDLKQVESTASELQVIGAKVHWKGVIGSSLSFLSSAVAEQVPGNHLFILDDKEQAAYFLNDLGGLYPENKHILFYPASYKVPYQLEETDNANVVARAEVLERINSGKNNWIITYPKALFERIPSKKVVQQNTLKLEVGKSYGLDLINEELLELHFDRVDFVYEPGQFSIRGGIVDIFSFANDDPFRVEFFGDEVESIRTFDASNQLSIKTHQLLSIVPNIQGQMAQMNNVSFLEYLGESVNVWLSSFDIAKKTLEKEYKKAVDLHAKKDTPVTQTLPSDLKKHACPYQLHPSCTH